MKITTVGDVTAMMEQWAPPEWAASWDKIGLHTGSLSQSVRCVLVCLSVTRTAFNAACKIGADLILAHHPLIWDPLATLSPENPHTRLCMDIHGAGIACYAAHTNLDAAPEGVNHALAQALGLERLQPLFPVEHATQLKLVTFVPDSHLDQVRTALSEAGAGIIGHYSHCSFNIQGTGTFLPGTEARPFCGKKGLLNREEEWRLEMIVERTRLSATISALLAAHPYEEPAYDLYPLLNTTPGVTLGLQGCLPHPQSLREFVRLVSRRLHVATMPVAGNPGMRIRTVGVLGGSGGSYMHRIPGGVDAYVTGDVSYHEFEVAREKGLAVLDAGHEATERPVLQVIRHKLMHTFPSIKTLVHHEPQWIRHLGANA